MTNGKSCFVISPIGTDGSPQRKRADTVLKHIFKPALEPLGYTVVRADEISQPGSITLQVLERVLESHLVVADLTDHNPNVFYELAVRHASERAVIHVISAEQSIPFDVADLRTVKIATDLDGADQARVDIAAQVREIEAGHAGTTPVKLAGVLKHMATGKSDEKVILKQILDGMTEIRNDYRSTMTEVLAHSKHALDVALDSLKSSNPADEVMVEEEPDAFLRAVHDSIHEALNNAADEVAGLYFRGVDAEKREYSLETTQGRRSVVQLSRFATAKTVSLALLLYLSSVPISAPRGAASASGGT